MENHALNNSIAGISVRSRVGTVAVMVAVTMLAAMVASTVVAQTPPSQIAAPKARPNSTTSSTVSKASPPIKKSCAVYGEGFVNVPGTDTCIKLGGYVRSDAVVNQSH